MIPLKRIRWIVVMALAAAAAACRGPGRPKLEATAHWEDVSAPAGCVRRMLVLDVATVAYLRVAAPGTVVKADEDGKARLEVRQTSIGRADTVSLTIDGAQLAVAVPPAGAPRSVAVAVNLAGQPKDADGVWFGMLDGALAEPRSQRLVGAVVGQDLVWRLTGCDLRGGSIAGGSVIARGPDDLEVHLGLARRLAGLSTLRRLDETIEVTIENTDGQRAIVGFHGGLEVTAALAAMQAAAGSARASTAPPWQPGAANPVLVAARGLAGERAIARASALLLGKAIGEAAGVVVVARTADGFSATVSARATGDTIAERAFPTAGGEPPWDDVLAWVEDVQQGKTR
jgi:hypothetical protein